MGTEVKGVTVYEFGPFRLDPSVRRLERHGHGVPLTAKLFDILLLLVRRHGELVSKEELIAQVWSDRIVEDNNLTVSVSTLRKILGETHGVRREYIETVPKRGYRFVARVRESAAEEDGGAAAPENRGSQIRALAVLPLVNAEGNAQLEYLSDGITEGIINTLSCIPQLRVMARSTVFRYKGADADPREVGARLGVGGVLVGKLWRAGESLSVSVELVDVRDGSQIWGGVYDREMSDSHALQGEIAREIAERLLIKLTSGQHERLVRPRTEDWEAYNLYLKGRYFHSRFGVEQMKKAMRYFEAAAALDNGYALAYAGLADCYAGLAEWHESPPKEAFPKAKEMTAKALEIDDGLAEAHSASASIKELFDWDFAAAEREYLYAINLNPNLALGHQRYATYLSRAGRWEEALAEIHLSQRTDPRPEMINFKLGRALYYARKYERAAEHCREALRINSLLGEPRIIYSLALLEMDRHEEAVAEALEARRLMRDDPEGLATLGYVYARAGRSERALEVLAELHELSQSRYLPHFMRAIVYGGLGERDQLFHWLDKAFDERSYYILGLKMLPMFDAWRADPRFVDLLGRIAPARAAGASPVAQIVSTKRG